MAKRLAGLHPLAYMGVNPSTPPQMIHKTHAPTPNNDENVNIGAIWVVTDTDEIYMLTSLAGGVATWTPMSGLTVAGGTGITVTTVGATSTISVGGGLDGQILVGATGTDADWAYLTSTGGTISIAEGANTLNIEATGVAGLTQLDADTGSATPVAGAIMIAGGTNITTSAATDTVTITLDDPLVVNALTISGLTTGVLVADVNGVVDSINGTDGQLIIAGTGLDPIWANLTSANSSIIITEGPNTLDVRSASGAGSPYVFMNGSISIGASEVLSGVSFESPNFVISSYKTFSTFYGRIYTSSDAVTWTQRLNVAGFASETLRVVHCGSDGNCVTGGNQQWTWVATDPTSTWTKYAFPNNVIVDLNYGGGYWVALSHDISTSAPEIATTADPTTAYTVNGQVFAEELLDTAYGGGVWVVVGENGYLLSTADPTGAWTQRTSTFSGDINAVTYSSDLSLFCAVGEFGEVATSSDGTTWTQRPNPFMFSSYPNSVVWDSNEALFMAISKFETALSYNGIIWFEDKKALSVVSNGATDIAYGDTNIVALRKASTTVMTTLEI